jgi:cell division protein FtsZ
MFELMDAYSQSAVIKVIGVGGGGGNAVTHMVSSGIDGVDFMCINTDAQALKHSKVKTALQIGCNITKGLGAGADPEIGRQAAMEDRDRIIELVEGCDMLFITAGMGGGTGTGAAPVVAQIAKELGILTVAVVTKPFEMEGGKRSLIADHGIAELGKFCDSLITIPNQKLLTVLGPETTLLNAFKSANQVLQGAVQGIAELITRPGLINVDFADVRTVMAETGMAMMGSGVANGEGRARIAADAAAGGHQPRGRSRHSGERYRRHGPLHRRVSGSRPDREAICLRGCDRRRGHRDRSGTYDGTARYRGGNGARPAGSGHPRAHAARDASRPRARRSARCSDARCTPWPAVE